MIQVTMTSPDGVTLDTAGKYCPEDVRVVPEFDCAVNAKRWTIELVGTTTMSSGIALEADPWLAAHCNDPNLCFQLLKTSDRNNVYGNLMSNSLGQIYHSAYGIRMASTTNAVNSTPFSDSNSTAAGYMRVTQDGNLKYTNGSSVYFTDGTYVAIAWLV